MDCRSFRRKHLAYLDDTLSGVETKGMRKHLGACEACAQHDASVRRALLVVRNLPAVTPSPDFGRRLRARIAAETLRGPGAGGSLRGPSVGLFMSVAASVVVVGVLVTLAGTQGVNNRPYPRLPAVVADIPAAPTLSGQADAAPAIVASMSTGMPIWSALLLAEEGSVRLARTAFEPVSWAGEAAQR